MNQTDYSQWHRTAFSVRDYECDMQARVNNSVYGHYFEHARHTFLQVKGIDFALLCAKGIHLVVSRIEIDYRKSLHSGDSFIVYTKAQMQGRLKLIFQQDLVVENTVHASAKVTGIALNTQNKPFIPEFFSQLISI